MTKRDKLLFALAQIIVRKCQEDLEIEHTAAAYEEIVKLERREAAFRKVVDEAQEEIHTETETRNVLIICYVCGKKMPILPPFYAMQIDGEQRIVCSTCYSEKKKGTEDD